MLIHSYLTNGSIMYDFAILFLQSLKKWDGTKYKVLFEGRDLTDAQINGLRLNYKNIIIKNETINYKKVANSIGVTIDRVKEMKNDCENKIRNVGTSGCVPWKQFISVEDRYKRTLKSGIEYCINNNINHMIHFDIDTCFYSSLQPIEDIVRKHDVTLQFRAMPKVGRLDKTKIVGGFLGFKCNENSYKFINKWIEIIDLKKLKNKPKGYGQLSLYLTYKKLKSKIDIGTIDFFWSATKKNIQRWLAMKKKVIILNASKGSKEENLKIFRKLLKDKK